MFVFILRSTVSIHTYVDCPRSCETNQDAKIAWVGFLIREETRVPGKNPLLNYWTIQILLSVKCHEVSPLSKVTFALRLVLMHRQKKRHTLLVSPGFLGFHVRSSRQKKWLISPTWWRTTAIQLPPTFRHRSSRLSWNTQGERLPKAEHGQPRRYMEESAK